MTPRTRKPGFCRATGRQRAVEIRVYDYVIMKHDTITSAPQATPETAVPWPEHTPTELPAGTVAAAHPAHGTPVESCAAASTTADAAPPEAAAPPDLDRLGDQIAKLSARIDAATYDLLCHLHQFDRHHGWEGFRSCAHWLNWRTGLDLGAAREKLRVAAALADLNHIAAALARGQLSYSKVRALTRIATPDTEARLLALALSSTAAQVERLVRGWRQADREAQPDAEPVRLASRGLRVQVDEEGMVVVRGRLTPEVGAVLLRAVEAALEQVPATAEGEEATLAQRRADALGLVAESALAGGLDPGSAGERFQVTVHVPAAALAAREPEPAAPPVAAAPSANSAETRAAHASEVVAEAVVAAGHPHPVPEPADRSNPEQVGGRDAAGETSHQVDAGAAGAPRRVSAERCERDMVACESRAPATELDAGQAVIEEVGGLHLGREAARRVACDAGLVVLRHGSDGEVLDAGRRTRTVPTALRRALQDRDRNQCQFPGCESRHCDAHHVVHWADGGETRLTNLILACRFHHRALHEEGFRVVATGDGGFQFLRPDGVPLPAVPAVARWEGAPLAPIDARLEAAGISIGPHTATPEWYGEPLELAAALEVLWEPPKRRSPGRADGASPRRLQRSVRQPQSILT